MQESDTFVPLSASNEALAEQPSETTQFALPPEADLKGSLVPVGFTVMVSAKGNRQTSIIGPNEVARLRIRSEGSVLNWPRVMSLRLILLGLATAVPLCCELQWWHAVSNIHTLLSRRLDSWRRQAFGLLTTHGQRSCQMSAKTMPMDSIGAPTMDVTAAHHELVQVSIKACCRFPEQQASLIGTAYTGPYLCGSQMKVGTRLLFIFRHPAGRVALWTGDSRGEDGCWPDST